VAWTALLLVKNPYTWFWDVVPIKTSLLNASTNYWTVNPKTQRFNGCVLLFIRTHLRELRSISCHVGLHSLPATLHRWSYAPHKASQTRFTHLASMEGWVYLGVIQSHSWFFGA